MYKYVKSFLDKIIAFILLILISPIFMIVALLIFIQTRQNVFFIQKRVGKDNKIFKIIKFKTMNDLKDKNGNLLDDEQRLHNIGRFIRNHSLDELPQLINIIKGDMSFIGPRPLLIEYLPLYSKIHIKRHDVLSGITGLAQINGRNSISWSKRFDLDIKYVENISFLLDIQILFNTIIKVIKKEGISSQTSVTMEKFKGYDNE
jgi:lipopolysaccharide/colanic/teichoic acid biosynthesis glycosyltransferase